MKTSELTGPALDWAVAKCEGVEFQSFLWAENQRALDGGLHYYNYSINWLSGGPIIERERIGVKYTGAAMEFVAWKRGEPSIEHDEYGPTPLVAAMRCFVASKLGDTIDIPEELK